MTRPTLLTTKTFERDLKRVGRQRKDLDKLEAVVDLLQASGSLPRKCRAHPFMASGKGIGIATSSQIGF
jgi:addiction module RelE/StbE family toxin